MANRKSPSLSDVVQRAASAPRPAAASGGGSGGETRGLLLRVPMDLHRELRQLAVDEDTTLQALGVAALRALLAERASGAGGA